MEKFYLIVGRIFVGFCVGYIGTEILWQIVRLITENLAKIFKQHKAIIEYIWNRKEFKEWKKLQKKCYEDITKSKQS